MASPVPCGLTPEQPCSHPDKSILAGKGAGGVVREVAVEVRTVQVASARGLQHWAADGWGQSTAAALVGWHWGWWDEGPRAGEPGDELLQMSAKGKGILVNAFC